MIDKSRKPLKCLAAGSAAVLLCLALALPRTATAATASELFADGNRLFRDNLYWAALLRYDQAAEAGLDTPLLHFNTGVAHYRAGQHVRARESLRKASRYGPLTPISHYNLGLNAYAMGDNNEALGWFRRARDQEQDKQISKLARKAIAELQRGEAADEPVEIRVAAENRVRPLTNTRIRASVGAGTDDNVYRSPSESYVDVADPTQPTVDPVVQSGMFIPVDVSAKYRVNALENEGFFGAYRFVGRFYQDTNLSNADEYLQQLSFGSEYRRREEERDRRVFSAFSIAQHDETYYDPDTGVNRTVNGVDVSDRLSYLRYGPEFWIKERFGNFSIGGQAKGQLWNYDTVEGVPEYDHEYWKLGLTTDYRFGGTSLIRANVEYYTRRFGDRPAFKLDGTQPVGNPNIRYDYRSAGITARQRITSRIWFGFDYVRTDREDRHVGYNDYSKDTFGMEMQARFGQRFDLSASAYYHLYDFENALAFHEPAGGPKTLEVAEARVRAVFDMTRSLSLVSEYRYKDVVSTDTRIAYNRSLVSLSVRWAHQ